jgi:TPR repeat protein
VLGPRAHQKVKPYVTNVSAIFISYRRDDTAPYAGRIYDRLTAHFGEGRVFMDIDQLEPGEDFVEVINHKVSACETAIVLIGKNWLTVTDAEGRRRLDDAEDFVRLEVAAALERKVRVVPVLVGGAGMPRMQELPDALVLLSRRNAVEISDTRFHRDVDRLIEALEKTTSASATQSANVKESAARSSSTATAQESKATQDKSQASDSGNAPARGGGKRWQIVAGAMLGAAVLAFVAVRGSNTARPPARAANAPEVTAAPAEKEVDSGSLNPALVQKKRDVANRSSADAPAKGSGRILFTGDANNPRFEKSLVEYEREVKQELTARAKAGSAQAQFELGVIFETGESRNLEEAAKWYKLAATQGYPLARQGLDDVNALARQGETALDLQMKHRQLGRESAQFKNFRDRMDAANAEAKTVIQSIGR